MGVTDQSRHSEQISLFTELAARRPVEVNDLTDWREAYGPSPGADPTAPVGFLATEEVAGVE
jgi:hypothetical protein